MRALDLQTVLSATGGKVLSGPSQNFTGVGTDTRVDLKGQLFIALKGEAFDAHSFVDKAAAQGAAGILVHEENAQVKNLPNTVTVIKVADTLKALQDLGRWARRQSEAKVVGITGSNGKTTTKEFAAALIGSACNVHYNKGSFNNHWGVPFTLLQLPIKKDVAVVEMGMNHAGELTELVKIAEPDVVVCTTVGRAHMEFFGTIEKVAEAKEEIYLAAAPNACRIYNLDNVQTHNMYVKHKEQFPKSPKITFSTDDPKADVHLVINEMNMRELHIKGKINGVEGSATVQVFGSQNLVNLMAAASLGLAVGMTPQEVWAGLEKCKTNWGRNQLVHARSGAEIIFDAYNANPDSMRALIENVKLLSVKGKKVGVFGQMLEMGKASPDLHQELGEWAGNAGFDKIYFVGADAQAFRLGLEKVAYRGENYVESSYSETMSDDLKQYLKWGDVALIKGSRGMKLERFVLPLEPTDFTSKD